MAEVCGPRAGPALRRRCYGCAHDCLTHATPRSPAGRDKNVFVTDLSEPNQDAASVLLVAEENPVLQLELSDDGSNLWVATTSSSLHNWPTMKDRVQHRITSAGGGDVELLAEQKPLSEKHIRHIQGAPSIRRFQVLSDNHRVLTLDTEEAVTMWDVVTLRKLKTYGKVDFDEQVKAETKTAYVPKWCSVDSKLGSLSVHLEGEACFSAWIYGPTIDGLKCGPDDKINLGGVVLQALLREWQKVISLEDHRRTQGDSADKTDDQLHEELHKQAVEDGLSHDFFVAPPHTPLMLSHNSDPPTSLARFMVNDAGEESIKEILQREHTPWLYDALFSAKNRFGTKTDPIKLVFDLEPEKCADASLQLKKLDVTHLVCPAYLPIFKVAAHVIKELKLQGCEAKPPTASHSGLVEICCNDGKSTVLKVLDPSLDLATVKFTVWAKGDPGDDLKLFYRLKQTQPKAKAKSVYM